MLFQLYLTSERQASNLCNDPPSFCTKSVLQSFSHKNYSILAAFHSQELCQLWRAIIHQWDADSFSYNTLLLEVYTPYIDIRTKSHS